MAAHRLVERGLSIRVDRPKPRYDPSLLALELKLSSKASLSQSQVVYTRFRAQQGTPLEVLWTPRAETVGDEPVETRARLHPRYGVFAPVSRPLVAIGFA